MMGIMHRVGKSKNVCLSQYPDEIRKFNEIVEEESEIEGKRVTKSDMLRSWVNYTYEDMVERKQRRKE
jgi:hypothetical protein